MALLLEQRSDGVAGMGASHLGPVARRGQQARREQRAQQAHPAGESLSAYVDGALGPDAFQEVTRHLRECAECRATVVAYGRGRHLIRGMPEQSPPHSLLPMLRRRIEAIERPARPGRQPRRWRWMQQPAARELPS
jgi:anti-sigma factor RsiW